MTKQRPRQDAAEQLQSLSERIKDRKCWEKCVPPATRSPRDQGYAEELFTPETVTRYKDDPKQVTEEYDHPIDRHYVQPLDKWGSVESVATILSRFNIPRDAHATVIGGYTGEFAAALRECGLEVLFTDPIEGWCDKAAANGFDTECILASELTNAELEKTDVIVSFELYQAFAGEKSTYDLIRYATPEYGCLLFESEFTRRDMDHKTTPLSSFSWIKSYGGDVTYRESDGLRAYSCRLPETKANEDLTAAGLVYWLTALMGDSNPNTPTEPIIQVGKPLLESVADVLNAKPSEIYERLVEFERIVYESKYEGTTVGKYKPRNQINSSCGILRLSQDSEFELKPLPPWGQSMYSE